MFQRDVQISSATSLSIEYGDGAIELALASLFSTTSPSLLLFSFITCLSFRYIDAWVDCKPDTPTPLDRFLSLLSLASASFSSSSVLSSTLSAITDVDTCGYGIVAARCTGPIIGAASAPTSGLKRMELDAKRGAQR